MSFRRSNWAPYAAVWMCAYTALQAWAQTDVTQPGDPTLASSANSPGSEAVANAIDNQPTKYLNFDSANNGDSGLVISPSVGVTLVTGISLQAANDEPVRDPKIVLIEGSNDNAIASFSGGTWETITTLSDIPAFSARFATQSFSFANDAPYKHYRLTVLETQTSNTCCFQIAEIELLGKVLPSDVTQPTDRSLASSANSPGSEGVANAFDNQPTKYLNFDSANNGDSGLMVTPAIGRTLVTGITLQSANDEPVRDPKILKIEGSNDDSIATFNSGTWTAITTLSDIPPFLTRFQTQYFVFDNFQPYKHYRLTVLETATSNTCCFQIAEIQLLGGSPQDVTQPGDRALASSANSPGSEGVANAIDGQPTKYLNFDSANNGDSGMVVTPSVGPTTIFGLTLQSANDEPVRDPKILKIEGSNDATIATFNSGTWQTITTLSDIPAFAARFSTQEFFFPNTTAYKHYRLTVLETQTSNTCCFQVAEVELIGVIDKAPPTAKFLQEPVETRTLQGESATFQVKVDGPWTVQWYRNGVLVPGARGLTFATAPVTAGTVADTYQAEIVGAGKSLIVKALLFAPSATTSVAVNFRGTGANGAPTDVDPIDIGGAHAQAYWNNGDGNSGSVAPALDSNNADSPVTVSWTTAASWGTGTGTDNADRKMFNGYLGPENGSAATVTFENVPAGTHSVLVYAINRPLAFNDGDYSVQGAQASPVIYIRSQNADEYNASPGFLRGTATDPAARSVANYIRFDGIQRAADGTIVLTAQSTAEPGETPPGCAPVNGVQLLLNPPAVGNPPIITSPPTSQNLVAGGNASFSVQATGTAPLSYQWRKDGVPIPGATTPTFNVTAVTAASEGAYTVVVSNAVATAISVPAVLSVYNGLIGDRLVAHFKFDEVTGLVAANAVAGGQAGALNGYTDNVSHWGAGKTGGSLGFNGTDQFVIVPNYTKPTTSEAISAWVMASDVGDDATIIANAGIPTQQGIRLSQFELGTSDTDGDVRGRVVAGPNRYSTREGAAFPLTLSEWHHVALTADGARVTLYRDGQIVGSVEYLGRITDPTVPCMGIGALLNETCDGALGGYWNGRIDDVALWTRTLGAAEVTALYQAGLAGGGLSSLQGGATASGLNISKVGPDVVLTWTGAGRLQTSTNFVTWNDVAPQPANKTFTIPAATGSAYYQIEP